MADSYLAKELLRCIFLPPGFFIFGLLLAWIFRNRLWAKRLLMALLLLMWLMATPLVANGLMSQVEAPPLSAHSDWQHIDAIVCLGGGKRTFAADFPGNETINDETLARLRFTAILQRQSGKPVLVSGGAPRGGVAEADLMRASLEQDFQIPVHWVENHSNDTRDNAQMSAAQLLPKYRRIMLVTSAYHIPRAVRAFRAAGFEVSAAPTDFASREALGLLSILPRASALQSSTTALREIIGGAWYRIRQ